MRKSKKYSDELKIQAGEMFESGMTGKQVAEKLGVKKWVAFYLEYEGRKLKGTLTAKRAFHSRPNGKHPHKKHDIQPVPKPVITGFETKQDISPKEEIDSFQVQDFVENNVSPVPTHSKFTGSAVLFIISVVIAYALYF